MLTLLGAALMQPAAAYVPASADLRCMAAYLFAVGQMSGDPKASAEDKAAGTSIVMYYFGKIRAGNAGLDIKTEIRRLVEQPGYVENQLRPDLESCGKEFEARGKELEAFGSE